MKNNWGIVKGRDIFVFIIQIYFFLLPFEYVLSTSVGSINRYVSLLIVLATLVYASKLKIRLETMLVAAWLGFCILSVLWTNYAEGWRQLIAIYALNILLFSVVNSLDFHEYEYKRIQFSYIAGALALVLYLIFSSSVEIDDYSGRSVIKAGIDGYYDPNYMAAVLIIPLGIVYKKLLEALEKKFWLTMAAMMAICLAFLYVFVISGSRGGMLGAAAAILAITVFSMKNSRFRRRVFVLLALVVLIALVAVPLVPEKLAQRFALDSLLGKTDGGAGRLEIWGAAWEVVKKNPILGYGAGSTNRVLAPYFGDDRAVHNIVFALWIETGMVALLVLFSFVRLLFRSFRNGDYLECSLWGGILVASLFLDAVSTRYLWSSFMLMSMRKNISNASIKGNKF